MAKSQRGIGIAMSYISVAIGLISTLLYTPVMTSIVGEVDYGIYSWHSGSSKTCLYSRWAYMRLLHVFIPACRQKETEKDWPDSMAYFFACIWSLQSLPLFAVFY